mmetsp:Transcript_8604/g.25818  ORF Transcript_8604/g.25818 Transcript_8604/m.25818 type:complete len:314 (-) Transcript_8604:560-1501(-)
MRLMRLRRRTAGIRAQTQRMRQLAAPLHNLNPPRPRLTVQQLMMGTPSRLPGPGPLHPHRQPTRLSLRRGTKMEKMLPYSVPRAAARQPAGSRPARAPTQRHSAPRPHPSGRRASRKAWRHRRPYHPKAAASLTPRTMHGRQRAPSRPPAAPLPVWPPSVRARAPPRRTQPPAGPSARPPGMPLAMAMAMAMVRAMAMVKAMVKAMAMAKVMVEVKGWTGPAASLVVGMEMGRVMGMGMGMGMATAMAMEMVTGMEMEMGKVMVRARAKVAGWSCGMVWESEGARGTVATPTSHTAMSPARSGTYNHLRRGHS